MSPGFESCVFVCFLNCTRTHETPFTEAPVTFLNKRSEIELWNNIYTARFGHLGMDRFHWSVSVTLWINKDINETVGDRDPSQKRLEDIRFFFFLSHKSPASQEAVLWEVVRSPGSFYRIAPLPWGFLHLRTCLCPCISRWLHPALLSRNLVFMQL